MGFLMNGSTSRKPGNQTAAVPDFLAGGGEMGELMRAHDWASTPVGPPESWPQSLRLTVRLVLNTQHPMFIWWGEELIQFYNDGYRQTMGPEMHPAALGARGRECWASIWPIIGPQIEQVMAGKGATWNEHQMVPINRHGGLKEVWWTYGYSPIDLDGKVGGVLVVCTDVTEQHLLTEELQSRNSRMAQQFEAAPGFIAVLRGPDHVFELTNAAYRRLIGDRDVIGRTVLEGLPEVEGQGFIRLLDEVLRTGKPHVGRRTPVSLKGPEEGATRSLYLDFVFQPIVEADGSVSGIFVEGQDVSAHVLAEEQLVMLNRELQHRVRNMLSMVGAVANQTLREAAGPEAIAAYQARLCAFAAAQDALAAGAATEGWLETVIRAALGPHMQDGGRIALAGPPVKIGSRQAVSISLAMHELATNATKYGALSNETGAVAVDWSVAPDADGTFRLSWQEHGGPAVRPPTHSGFGSLLLKGALTAELGGEVDLDFRAEGLHLVLSTSKCNLLPTAEGMRE